MRLLVKPNPDPVSSPLDNQSVADALDEVAELLEGKGVNPYRVRAYHRAANTIRSLALPMQELIAVDGWASLTKLPGIGDSIARSVERLAVAGELPLLERLRGRGGGETLLTTVPGVGQKTAARIHEALGIRTLPELEAAAHDGRLAALPGMGRKRIRAVCDSLAARLGRHPPVAEMDRAPPANQPPVTELLSIDEEFRRKAGAGRLPQVAPRRFNPTGEAWLPILHARREGRRYTALYSNTARAHQLGMNHDWVVIVLDAARGRGQWTVITSRRGALKGRRIVRGREKPTAPRTTPHTSIRRR